MTVPSELDEPALRIHGPEELLEAIPYLLGFHPSASLVLVGLEATSLVVTVRLGLDGLERGPTLAEAIAAMSRGGGRAIGRGVLSGD